MSSQVEGFPDGFFKAVYEHLCQDVGGVPMFTFRGEPVTGPYIESNAHLLPAMLWRTDQIYQKAYDRPSGLGFAFVENPRALLGRSVDASELRRPVSEVVYYVVEAFIDVREMAPADPELTHARAIDFLVEEFCAAFPSPTRSERPSMNG
jgi:hypothetical protein